MKKFLFSMLMLFLFNIYISVACGDTLTLPASLKVIEEEAFYGVQSVSEVVIPEGVTEIRSNAFANSSLSVIHLPSTLTFIAKDALPASDALTVIADEGSYAHDWAVENGYIAPTLVYPESAHPYPNNKVQNWSFDWPGDCEALSVTFSEKTSFSVRDASLQIIDSNGHAASYTGKELSSKTVLLPGKSFQLKLRPQFHDGSFSDYGFSIDDIHPVSREAYEAYAAEQEIPQVSLFQTSKLYDDTLLIMGYTGSESVLTIPSSIDGIRVSEISSEAFKGNTTLTQLIVSDGISSIHYRAFYGCDQLTSVVLPGSVTRLDDEAFDNCPNLETFTVESGSYAYIWAVEHGFIAPEGGFEVLPLPEDGDIAVEENRWIWQHIDGNGGLLKFWVNAPAQWSVAWNDEGSAVTSVYNSNIYPRWEIANGSVFEPESHYLWLDVDENDTGAVRDVTVQFTCGNQTLEIIIRQLPCLYSRLIAPEFIAEYTGIEEDMPRFSKDEPLTLIWETTRGASKYKLQVFDYYCGIPSGIEWPATDEVTTSITLNGDFFDDLWMKDFDLRGLELRTEDEWGHAYYDKVYWFHVIMDPEHPDYDYSLYWDDDTSALAGVSIVQYLGNAAELTIPSILGGYATRFISGAFHSNDALTHVTIPEGVEGLSWAFMDCPNLTGATLPASLTYISEDTFSGCPALETITAEEGSYAYCWAVQHGYIAADAAGFATRKLADGALEIAGYSGNEANLKLPGEMDGIAVTSIGKNAFRDNATLNSVTIPQGVTRISYGAFENCANLTEVNLPNSITRIGNYAFMDCKGLTHIALPDGLVSIGFSSFEETGLTHIEIPEGVTELGEYAFYRCDDLELAIIHEGIKHITHYAFNCDGLTCICIPKSVVYIENDFRENLSTVYGIPGSYAQTWAEKNGYTFIDWTTQQPDIPASNPIAIDETNFPDDVFREYVRQFDLDGNGELSMGEIKKVNQIDVNSMEIGSLEGIEHFSSLTHLYCYNNHLNEIDISNNTSLVELYCGINYITSLNVSTNVALSKLYCFNNQLSNLDVTQNSALTGLQCQNNSLHSLDISNNTKLTFLTCSGNFLDTLDVSNNVDLRNLNCSENKLSALELLNNTALTYLDCSKNLLSVLDIRNNLDLSDLDCSENELIELDVDTLENLIYLSCFNNHLKTLNMKRCIKLTHLRCEHNQISELDLSNSTVLVSVECFDNQLISLDVSGSRALVYLNCDDNCLSSLNVNNNIALTEFSCCNNLLDSLDVEQNTALKWFYCGRNQLTQLDLNHNIELCVLDCSDNNLKTLDVSNCPQLTDCISNGIIWTSGNNIGYNLNNSQVYVNKTVQLIPAPPSE